jgi:transposase
MRPALPARQTHDYRRKGLIDLYAAMNIVSGTVMGECRATHTGADFLRFLQVLCRRRKRPDVHVVLDNSSSHKTPEVLCWREAHPTVHFHFTPTGASWLNMVEAWFSMLTRRSVRRGSFDTVKLLARHIRNCIEHWNDNPTPFVWTKDPAAIIKKVLRRPG